MKRVIESDEFRCAKHYGCMDGFPTLNAKVVRVLKELLGKQQKAILVETIGVVGQAVFVFDIESMIEKLGKEEK